MWSRRDVRQKPSNSLAFYCLTGPPRPPGTESGFPAGVRGGPIETSAQRSLRSSELRLEFINKIIVHNYFSGAAGSEQVTGNN